MADGGEGDEYEVEQIRDRKVSKGQVLYLVKWCNWPEDANSWEPAANLSGCPDLLREFEKNRKAKQKEKGPTASASAPAAVKEEEPLTAKASPSSDTNTRKRGKAPAEERGRAKEGRAGKRGKQKEITIDEVRTPIDENREAVKEDAMDTTEMRKAVMEIASAQGVTVQCAFSSDSDSGDRGRKPPETAPAIEKILRPVNYESKTWPSGRKEISISFRALRADSEEVVVDNQYLRCNHPNLLIDFYEDHIMCTNAKRQPPAS